MLVCSALAQQCCAGLFVIVCTLAVLRLAQWYRKLQILQRLPHPKGRWLLGSVADIASPTHHKWLTACAAELGGIFSLRLAVINAVIVTDPHLVAEVLSRSGEVEKSVDSVYSHFNVLLHAKGLPNIFTSRTDDYWKLVRKSVAPAFNPKNIRKGFGHVLQVNRQLIDILRGRGPTTTVDLDNATQRLTLDVIGRVGFEKDFGATRSLDDNAANIAFDTMGAGRDEGVKRWNNPLRRHLKFLPSVRKGEQDFCRFRKIMADLLVEIKARGEPSDDDTSIATHLLRIRDPATGKALPDDRLAAEIGVFFTGGFETTGHTIAWTLFMISQHPEVEAKVLAELDSLGLLVTTARPSPRAMEYDDIAKLTYTTAATKESMRMLPVLTDGTNRTTDKDMLLGGHLIPAGTMIWIPFNALFNSPHNWDQPMVYRPERWSEPGAEYAKAPQQSPAPATGKPPATLAAAVALQASAGLAANGGLSDPTTAITAGKPPAKQAEAEGTPGGRVKRFMPFSEGRRDCVGQNLARMNYTTTLAMLLAHFSFKLAPEMGGMEGVRASESSGLLTLQPTNGIHMFCIPRA
ncbi:hypothetical protein WJX72_000759 [[Myrmecia] bisecta]|uniref:Cytochrome P450 n=1 Tax=[Myrmecia] bisecta TaxID=41462 RepID=A0AAW1PHB4_9CHLO